jgi:hypothetical protein
VSSSYGHPQLRVSISGDAEQAADLTAVESLHQFTFDGAIVWLMERRRIGRRGIPFVAAGAGYLRQLHEGNTLVVSGQTYYVGGGLKYRLMSRNARLKGLGVRGDLRALARVHGVAVDGVHVSPAIAGSIFVAF